MMIERLMPIFAIVGVVSFGVYLSLCAYVACRKLGLDWFAEHKQKLQ